MESREQIQSSEFKKLIRGLAKMDIYLLRKIVSNEVSFQMLTNEQRNENFSLAEEVMESAQYSADSSTNSSLSEWNLSIPSGDRVAREIASLEAGCLSSCNQLHVGTCPNRESDDDWLYMHMSLFELACQTPGCADFIRTCIQGGIDVNLINSIYDKKPINFIVESYDSDNLEALLTGQNVDINHTYSGLTPINFLVKSVTNESFESIFKCIQLLINWGANMNIPSNRDIVPIHNLLLNRYLSFSNKKILTLFMVTKNRLIDIDTYRNGEARILLKTLFPTIENKLKVASE